MEKILNQIKKEDLIINRWYLGRGRNSNLGYWNGMVFLTIGYKIDRWRVKEEGYFQDDDGCFQPFLIIDEGEMIESMGNSPWDLHYGKKLRVEM